MRPQARRQQVGAVARADVHLLRVHDVLAYTSGSTHSTLYVKR